MEESLRPAEFGHHVLWGRGSWRTTSCARKKGNPSVYLRDPVYMEFTWQASCEAELMCLDYVGKDDAVGAAMFAA